MKTAPAHKIRQAALTLVLALAALTATVSPASAHTSSDLGSIAAASGGCGWSSGGYSVLDSRAVRLFGSGGYNSTQVGTVYLLWSGTYGENCVVTLKGSSSHGTSTQTEAILYVQTSGGETAYWDKDEYAHYAAVSRYTSGRCVAFYGNVRTRDGEWGHGGRDAWGNCG
ncbi:MULTISPECIES: hypothetical protein [unclassified Nocardiopsis]|uniref:hypothetical protein n=1 Tax=unclassified Nocardiopsis TaxID=2649073 RepID=UPI0013590273|nr:MULTISPECIES: hypothetical protein [unclassified Nocardiopsis]